MNASELVQEYYRRTGLHRSDLNALAEFIETRESGQPDALTTVRLFWETLNPCIMVAVASVPVGNTDEEPPSLPDELEAEYLETLADLERKCRVYYAPDSENSIGFDAASQHVHVGAASALRHRRRDGLSDDVTRTLDDVRKILYRLGIETYSIEESDTGETISLHGVRAIVLSLQAQVMYGNTKYEEAFGVALSAFTELRTLVTMYNPEDFLKELLMEEWLGEGVDEEELEERIERDFEIRREIRIGDPLSFLDPQLMVDAFEGLKRQGKCDDWQALARNCDYLAITSSAELKETRVLVGDEPEISWNYRFFKAFSEVPIFEGDVAPHDFREKWENYWIRAKGWASTQLSPNEYREMRRRDEAEASALRLQRYFFGNTWLNLPEKARERVTNVDTLWFSESRGLDYGSIPNDFQVAVETMCHYYVWEPLLKAQGGREELDAIAPTERGKSPTLAQYIQVCRSPYFKTFVENQGFSGQQDFLTSRLPSALQYLLDLRNPGQHDPRVHMRRDQVERSVQLFLGIDCEGILPRLAEIGPKLARR